MSKMVAKTSLCVVGLAFWAVAISVPTLAQQQNKHSPKPASSVAALDSYRKGRSRSAKHLIARRIAYFHWGRRHYYDAAGRCYEFVPGADLPPALWVGPIVNSGAWCGSRLRCDHLGYGRNDASRC